jgi:hypothetical protein
VTQVRTVLYFASAAGHFINATYLVPGRRSGTTLEGRTGWIRDTQTGQIYADITTTGSKFAETPRYFTSLSVKNGPAAHNMTWRVCSGNAVFNPTANGFRVYLTGGGPAVASDLTELDWEAIYYQWTVSWIGIDPLDQAGGSSNKTSWTKMPGRGSTFETRVNTSQASFPRPPIYFYSIAMQSSIFRDIAEAGVSDSRKHSFQLDLKFESKANISTVNFFGYLPATNQVSSGAATSPPAAVPTQPPALAIFSDTKESASPFSDTTEGMTSHKTIIKTGEVFEDKTRAQPMLKTAAPATVDKFPPAAVHNATDTQHVEQARMAGHDPIERHEITKKSAVEHVSEKVGSLRMHQPAIHARGGEEAARHHAGKASAFVRCHFS